MDWNTIKEIRERVLRGEDVPAETIRECLRYLRQARTAEKAPKPKKAPAPSALDQVKALLES